MKKVSDDFLNIDIDSFLTAVDLMYDELLIYDSNYKIVYINKACSRHYCCTPEQMIGKSFFDFTNEDWWAPSILPMVYDQKKSLAIKQKTYTGKELLTIALPVFDDANNIKFVVMNVRDEVNEKDIFNPTHISKSLNIKNTDIATFKSKEMTAVIEMIQKISNASINLVLTGESGTGKTMLAKYLHTISDRKDEAFVNVNCASIPDELIESELFGYVSGAFTGASSNGKKGLFELAHKGILLLDEVAELSSSAQAKLLHVLQNGEYTPVGGVKNITVDVRIVAATNKNLKDLVATGRFREDLYYRLNVVEIYVPPLRKRKKDILPLIYYFLNEFNKKYGVSRYFSDDTLKILTAYKWPGNARELKHIVERLVVTIDTIVIDANLLPKNLFNISDEYDFELPCSITTHADMMEEFEEKLVIQVYEKHNSSRKLASYLSISQTKASKLITKYIKTSLPS